MGKGAAKGKAANKAKAKRADKIVEDKTFGLKNKNKSKKVQNYIKQVGANARHGKSEEQIRAEAAKKKREKEAQKNAEKEMLALLGEAYALDGKKKKKKKPKKTAEDEAKEAEAAKEKAAKMDEKDFGMPICSLRDVFGLGSKAVVERLCVELVHKDNLPGKAADGAATLFIKVQDGTTLNPMLMSLTGETPQSCNFKVGMILDVRGCLAMVRGDKVVLEIPLGAKGLSKPSDEVEASVEEASERLTEFIKQKIVEEEELRARGGIPIEERIEEERALLPSPGTPVTQERFLAWKEKKRKKKESEADKKRKDAKKSKSNVLSGRALFLKDKSLFVDDAGALGDQEYEIVEEEEAEADAATPPVPPAGNEDAVASAMQEKLYLEGDDDLDDLDDLDSDDE